MNIDTVFGLLGGLGLFLYGMQRMAEGLQKAAGDRLRQILELFTSHPLIAVVTGALVTVLVQSSSTTTVMIVGFVNAGLMNLSQAVGTIMGANIGTTITAQVVSFNIYRVALPCVGIGFILNFLCKNRTYRYIGLSLLGFGLLLVGMSTMSESLRPLRTYQPFLDLLVRFGQAPLLGVMAGALFTVLVQSSSATTGLVIAFSMQNLIDLPSGLALILGANLGTCITAQLAAIGASLTAKRAAMAHVLFNTFGVVVFLIVLKPFTDLIFLTSDNVTRQVANAHAIFNIVNTLLVFPFLSRFVTIVQRLVPGEETILECKPKYLDRRMLHSPAALMAATQEVLRMADISLDMLQESFQAFLKGDPKLIENVERKEDVVNDLEKAIITYLTEASHNPLSSKQTRKVTNLMHSVHDIERVGDHSTNIIELAQVRMDHKLGLSAMAEEEIVIMYHKVECIYTKAIELLRNERVDDAKRLIREDDIIDQMERDYRASHIRRLNEGTCHPEAGVVFLDLVSNLERVADHANNLAEAVAGTLLESEEELEERMLRQAT